MQDDYKKFIIIIIIIIIAFSMVYPPVGTCEVLIAKRGQERTSDVIWRRVALIYENYIGTYVTSSSSDGGLVQDMISSLGRSWGHP